MRSWSKYFLNLLLFCNTIIAQKIHRESIVINAIVHQWVDAHNRRDLGALRDLYDEKVLFYCMDISKEKSLEKKEKSLESITNLRIDPNGGIVITAYNTGIIKCDFVKDVTKNGKTKSYQSYLLLKKLSDKYKIAGESDKLTDKNLNFSLAIGEKVPFDDVQMEKYPIEDESDNSTLYVTIIILGITVVLILSIAFKKYRLKKRSLEVFPKQDVEVKISNDLKPNERKGYLFEQYVASKFNPDYFKIIDWKGDKGIIGNWAENNKNPDIELEFNHNQYSKKFAIECKWRQDFYDNFVDLGKEEKLKHYKGFQNSKRMPVYLAIGLGGTPQKPKDLYLVPLDEIFSSKMHRDTLAGYKKLSSTFFYDGPTNVLR